MLNITKYEVIENKESNQFITILNKLSNKTISYYKYFDYNKKLREINENNKNGINKNNEIPLLLFDTNENTKYYKYTNTLKNIIIHTITYYDITV